MGAPVIHFEIQSEDPKALQSFYAEQFDWNIENIDEMNYGLVDTASDGVGIGGGIGPRDDNIGSKVTFYVDVEDIDAKLAAIEEAGGKTVMPREELPMVTFALFTDPQGNLVGLTESAQDEPGE